MTEAQGKLVQAEASARYAQTAPQAVQIMHAPAPLRRWPRPNARKPISIRRN